MVTRLISLIALIGLWQIAAHFGNPRLLPGPMTVFATMRSEAASGRCS
jgi:ABC-type nitrate/sulfonate/bicarbonate transport system permease component